MSKINLPKQNNYEIAYKRAAEILRSSDLSEIARRCGVETRQEFIRGRYLGGDYRIRLPEVEFESEKLSMSEKILILHYVTTTGTHEPEGVYLAFKGLPGAAFYNPTYRKRGPNIIRDVFGNNPERLEKALEEPCVKKGDTGDVSLRIEVFPKIEALVIMYRGDDEFPPECQILYNDEIINLLPLEDVAVLAGRIAKFLMTRVG
jgi:hypothetical protein